MWIQELLEGARDEWGNPEENRANMLPYGIPPLDNALYGINLTDGELIAIQGEEKNRKTTLLANILMNMMPKLLRIGGFVVIDTLESGETIERYRDRLIGQLATYLLLKKIHGPNRESWPVDAVLSDGNMGMSPEFLFFHTRTIAQMNAIEEAMEIMADWPLQIFGGSRYPDRRTPTRALERSMARWRGLAAEGAVIFCTDHIQQYDLGGVGDYQKQEIIVPALAQHQRATSTVVIAVSQVSLASVKDLRNGVSQHFYARGGKKLSEEANVVIDVSYEEAKCRVKINVSRSRRARAACHQYLEPASGLFIGKPS